MKWWESSIHIIGIIFCIYAYIKIYSLIFKNKIEKLNWKIGIILFITTIVAYYNTFYNYGFSKILISFLEIFLVLRTSYKEDFKSSIFKTIVIYLICCTCEMIIGGLFFYIFFNSVKAFDQNIFFKFLFSVLDMLFVLLISNFKIFNKIFLKLYNLMCIIFNFTFSIILFLFILLLLMYNLIISSDTLSYISIFLIVIVLSIQTTITLFQIFKTKKATDKQQILLDFMKEYEMIIDKERIDRHEMVNNLLVLKSIRNKNSKQYNKTLDDILLTYQSNKTSKGLYELPSGLKGLFYYKIYDMKNRNIEVFINVSNKILKDLDNLDSKTLTKVCKILGILLDNAKESACEAKEKLVVIDLYKEEGNIIIYIENTIDQTKDIDVNKIKAKGFSTKGSNRGFGLYIVNKLLGDTNKILLNQSVKGNKFISIMKIKNN